MILGTQGNELHRHNLSRCCCKYCVRIHHPGWKYHAPNPTLQTPKTMNLHSQTPATVSLRPFSLLHDVTLIFLVCVGLRSSVYLRRTKPKCPVFRICKLAKYPVSVYKLSVYVSITEGGCDHTHSGTKLFEEDEGMETARSLLRQETTPTRTLLHDLALRVNGQLQFSRSI